MSRIQGSDLGHRLIALQLVGGLDRVANLGAPAVGRAEIEGVLVLSIQVEAQLRRLVLDQDDPLVGH
ncbi:hypothetical protein LP421_08460 [Rhizobium sp. RCAM05350]|nr:hypothetical protein LP421_08460 [Rhizobium sp. RCAM05350]